MVPESADALREEQLDEVLASYLDAVALGHAPSRQELLARYPELAAELAEFLEDRDRVERLAAPLREVSRQTIPPGRQPTDCADPGAMWADVADVGDVGPHVTDSRTPSFPPHAAARAGHALPPSLADYEVLGELGRGGMGVVYQARQKSLKRLVALKMLHVGGGATPEELERFRAEAETVAHLEHPNIVRIHEVGRQGDIPFLCLEFVEGGSLQRRLAGSPVAARPAAQLVETLARAVHFAHERGVVHRDLKPANVLLVGAPDAPAEQWVPKVTDFGLAKRIDVEAGQTPTGAVLGTPSYMAPEQARGWSSVVGPAADVYALGAILYELLTGRPPFRAATPMDTVLQVVQDEPVPPARLQPTCPRDLETVCLKCLQKEPGKRYATAQDLADDLRRWLMNEPIRARPAGVWERSRKWARRHPAVAGLVAVSSLAVLALAGAVAGHVFLLEVKVKEARAEVRQARDDKDQAEQDALRAEYRPQFTQARAALTPEGLERKDFDTAEKFALRVRAGVRDDPSLSDLKGEAEDLLNEVRRLRAALAKFRGLFRKRDEALFQLNRQLITALDIPESLAAARQAAEEALELFRVESEAEVGPVLDHRYSESEKQQITRGCFHVLLILADAVVGPRSLPAAGKQGGPKDREAVERALRILERANKLVPSTQVHHLRKARYLARLNETAAAREERALADRSQPAGPLDEFLVGSDKWLEAQNQRDVKNQKEALEHFKRALQGDPKLFWARLFLAVGRLNLRQLGEAKGDLTVCIDQRPDFVWSYLIRGLIHGELLDFKLAEADFAAARKLIEGRPDRSAEYVLCVNRGVTRARQGDYEAAAADLEKAVTLRPEQFHAYLNLGVVYREQGKRAEAVRLLATSLQPARLSAAVGVGLPWRDQRKWDDALRQFDQAIKIEPRRALLYRERAELHLLRKEPVAALDDFQRAIAREPGREEPHKDHLECGMIFYQDQRYEAAARAADAALRLEPTYALAHRLRGEAFFERAEKEGPGARKRQLYREALLSFDRYLVHGPPVVSVYQGRALAHAGLGDYAAAVGEYTQALAVRPRDPALHAARGRAYLVLDQMERARDAFTEAIRLDGTNGPAHNGRGFALVKLGLTVSGVAEARKALELGPPTPGLFYNAARVFAQAAALEESQPSRSAWRTGDAYREEAVDCLVRALAVLESDEKRAEFWHKVVRPDSLRGGGALYPLQRSYRFDDLAKHYDRLRRGAGPQ